MIAIKKQEERNEKEYFVVSVSGFRISLVFGLHVYANNANMAG